LFRYQSPEADAGLFEIVAIRDHGGFRLPHIYAAVADEGVAGGLDMHDFTQHIQHPVCSKQPAFSAKGSKHFYLEILEFKKLIKS
jgi:hypothetical protein